MRVWGIDGAVFWWSFGGMFLVAVCGYAWAQLAGPKFSRSGIQSLGSDRAVYELAYLNGGPDLTITAAAVTLHQADDVAGDSELERSLIGMLREQDGASVTDVRRRIAASADMQRLDARLMDLGLIRHPRAASLERWSLSAAFALLAIACIRFAAEADLSLVTELVLDAMFATALVTLLCVGHTHRLMPQGHELLQRCRRSHEDLRTPHAQSDLPLAVALYGGGVLWHADPALASAWEVPREDRPTGIAADRVGCGGGTCSDGTASCSCG